MSATTVVTETLSDRSKVYNVHTLACDGRTIIFACYDKSHAESLAKEIERCSVDTEIRDGK